MTTTRSHSLLAKVFHWGFIILFIYAIYKGLDDLDQLADPAFLAFEMKFASMFLLVLSLRYFYMHKTQASVLPEDTPTWMQRAARLGHLSLYISIGSIALTGLIIGALYWLGMTGGLIINGVVALHEFSITLSYLCIAIHISAAIYHRLRKDGVWSAMVPVWKE